MWNIFALFIILHVILSANAQNNKNSTNILPIPCSVAWKPYYHNKAPATDGYIVGKNQRNYDIYVGKGTFQGQTGPGNIQIEGDTGFYYPWGGSEHNIWHNIYYLSVIGNCNCRLVPQPINQRTPGLVTIQDAKFLFYVGFFKFPGTNYYTVGKITVQYNGMYYADNRVERFTNNFAALACV